MLEQYRSPRTAEAFGIAAHRSWDTRPLLCEWVKLAYELLPSHGAQSANLQTLNQIPHSAPVTSGYASSGPFKRCEDV